MAYEEEDQFQKDRYTSSSPSRVPSAGEDALDHAQLSLQPLKSHLTGKYSPRIYQNLTTKNGKAQFPQQKPSITTIKKTKMSHLTA